MSRVNSLSLTNLSQKVQLSESILMLSAAVAFPFLIHLIPPVNNLPMGAILLPAFYAPFIAVYFFRVHVGLIAALFGPSLNYVLTNSPKFGVLPVNTLELVLFTIIAFFLLREKRMKMFSAPLALIAGKGLSSLLATIPALGIQINSNPAQSIINAIPGLFFLLILNVAFVKFSKRN